ncbi:hypothetical protein HRbin01_00571 [archaeon HR01]|nr:hypothetical protein HRbin01_00571 [archaeon HR01]
MFPARDREEEYRTRLLNLAQDQIRNVLEVLRKTLQMLEQLSKENDVKKFEELYSSVLKSDEAARESKRMVEVEVSNIGAILTNREDFLRLINSVDRIADIAEGVAFRILGLARAKLKINKEILSAMVELGDRVLATVNRLREAILAVTLNSETFTQKVKETEDAERYVDELYRNIDFQILQSEMRIPQMLLSREIVAMLEDIADKAEETVETLRVLSFVIL